MQLANAVVLITGANRGIGLAFARGARRVVAAACDPATVTLAGVQPLQLDATDPGQVARAARDCPDVTVLVNNAGIATTGGFLQDTTLEATRRQMDTNLARGIEMPKSTPDAIVRAAFDGLEAGAAEVLADEMTRQVKQSLAAAQAAYLVPA